MHWGISALCVSWKAWMCESPWLQCWSWEVELGSSSHCSPPLCLLARHSPATMPVMQKLPGQGVGGWEHWFLWMGQWHKGG